MEIEQRSEAWFEARLGKATASRFKDILAKVGKGEAAARRNYRAQLVVERITGKTPDRFTSTAMLWGQETEELAIFMYETQTRNIVDKVGFLEHTELKAGASPDGLVGIDGSVEVKCLNSANHIEVLRTQNILPEYYPQVQGQLWIAARKWCDFISFDPDMPKNAQLFIQRVYRDEVYIKTLEAEVITFLGQVDREENYLRTYKAKEPISV